MPATALYCPECEGPLDTFRLLPRAGLMRGHVITMHCCADCQPDTWYRWRDHQRREPAGPQVREVPELRLALCAAGGCKDLREPGSVWCRHCAEEIAAMREARQAAEVTARFLTRWLVGCMVVLGVLVLVAQGVQGRRQADRLAAEARQPASDMIRWEMAAPDAAW